MDNFCYDKVYGCTNYKALLGKSNVRSNFPTAGYWHQCSRQYRQYRHFDRWERKGRLEWGKQHILTVGNRIGTP